MNLRHLNTNRVQIKTPLPPFFIPTPRLFHFAEFPILLPSTTRAY